MAVHDRSASAAQEHPLSVLVTRPAGAASNSLLEVLRAAGFRAYAQPLLELLPLDPLPAQQIQRIEQLAQYDDVVVISANAARFCLDAIRNYWPALPQHLRWYAVGTSTAQALLEHGITALSPASEMTSEGLLALPALNDVNGRNVLIAKGERGRDKLRIALLERGAQVDQLACYRRQPPAISAQKFVQDLQRWNIDVILLSSGEALENLRLLLSQSETSNVSEIGLIVPSDRVAQAALDAGFTRVTTAQNAADHAMLQALNTMKLSSGESE